MTGDEGHASTTVGPDPVAMIEVAQTEHRLREAPGSTWVWPDRLGRWGWLGLLAVVMVSYALGAQLAMLLIEASNLQGVFFIPAGITIAFLLRLPIRHWWIVLVGAAMAEMATDLASGYTLAQSLGYTAANVVEPLVGAVIVRPAIGYPDLARRRHLLWFIFGGVLLGPAVGGGIGALADRAFGGDDLLTTFGQWWLGDALGVILVGSAILAWGSGPDRRSLWSISGLVLIGGSASLTLALLELTDYPLMFFVLIGVVVAGVVYGMRAVVMTALAVALTMAVTVAVDPASLMAGSSPGEALLLIKLQLGTFALAGLVIAAESHEGELATREAAEAALARQIVETEQHRHRELALQVQRGLLPDRLVEHPKLEMAARYEAASDLLEVGGDWYDTISLGEGRVGLVVGDIIGHGTQAMISMGRLRTALGALAMRAGDPGSLLTEVDAFVGGPDGAVYATIFYAIVDTERHRIQYASAGHPPGLMVRPSGETIWLDRGLSGPLHGDYDSPRWHASVAFEPGSTLVLYSDGLIERRHESLDAGLGRLERLVGKLADRGVDTICEELFHRLGVGYSRNDDVVLLVARATKDHRPEYQDEFVATPEELRRVRASVRSWAEGRNLESALIDDLLIAVSEAAANSARHAYGDTEHGSIEVRISQRRELLEVAVIDDGKWKGSLDEVGDPGLGRSIIRSITDDFEIKTDGGGTVVNFKLPITGS